MELDTAPGEGATFRVLLPMLGETSFTPTNDASPTPPGDAPPAGLTDEPAQAEAGPAEPGPVEPSLRP